MGRPLWKADLSWSMPNGDNLAELRYWLESLEGYSGSVQLWNFAAPYPFGLNLVTSAGDPEVGRVLWSYLSNRAPWSYAGFPSHWALDSTVTISAIAAVGATSISLTGLDASKLVCVRGQYIQIGRRLYICTSTVTSSAGGTATVTFAPGLLAAVAINDKARLAEAACEMRLEVQDFDESAQAGAGLVNVSASFIETVTDFS